MYTVKAQLNYRKQVVKSAKKHKEEFLDSLTEFITKQE